MLEEGSKGGEARFDLVIKIVGKLEVDLKIQAVVSAVLKSGSELVRLVGLDDGVENSSDILHCNKLFVKSRDEGLHLWGIGDTIVSSDCLKNGLQLVLDHSLEVMSD